MQSYPLSELVRRIGDRRLTAEAVARQVVDAAQRNADLNAFTVFDGNQLLETARQFDNRLRNAGSARQLAGVPIVLKDNINTIALPTSGGTPALVNNVPKTDARIAVRLFEAGSLLAGKANMHELSSGGTSSNHVFGQVHNPYGATLTPGGSSGGVAAAVAVGIVPAGIGTDTAGSVRVPAALCGVIGFRPTVGRYPSEGIVPLSSSFDTAGPIARRMDDIILLDQVLADRSRDIAPRSLSTIKLGVVERWIEDASPHVAEAVEAALLKLSKAGIGLKAVDLSSIEDAITEARQGVIEYEFPKVMADYLADHAPHLTVELLVDQMASTHAREFTWNRLQTHIAPHVYQRSVTTGRAKVHATWQQLLQNLAVDAIAFPTTPDVALPLANDDHVMRNGEAALSWFYFENTALGATGRWPGITLPIGLSRDGRPVGLELDGPFGADDSLLAIASALETIAI